MFRTTTSTSTAAQPGTVPDRVAWHRPLLALAAAMALLAIVSMIGLVVDHREVTGLPLWAKPLKFSLSIIIYSVTLAWLIGLLRRGRRLAWWAGTISAVLLLVEMVAIVGAAAGDTTSHFNVSTPFHAAVWSIMAVSIVTVWFAAMVVAALLVFGGRRSGAALGDRARTIAIRSGIVIAIIGMGLAFLMTGPTAAQLDNFQGIAGAHTVGLADGGPGLPILGWSTVAGDLRIPHFVGMHALQLIPLAALLPELLMRRMPVLRPERTRVGIVVTLTALYSGVLVLLTLQALAGESIVRPTVLTITVFAVLYLSAVSAITVILVPGVRARRAEHAGQ
ncbi:hypothetical protein [Cryobacterium sp. PH31-L1]|uniref:hypothetical protein n=1 Tax=Cryobacterium sp. PH31-L1 TaxID=3046199 RepID=UPI0024B8C768|nr:hypothetical protein [Cryobacterium sp. PH31-L1]MDJ0378857.1 hypothetical protein [Cryobacterium sp. PH31-L1]